MLAVNDEPGLLASVWLIYVRRAADGDAVVDRKFLDALHDGPTDQIERAAGVYSALTEFLENTSSTQDERRRRDAGHALELIDLLVKLQELGVQAIRILNLRHQPQCEREG